MNRIRETIEWLKKNNWQYKAIALGLAIILWFYVTGVEADSLESIYTVPLEYRNLEEGYVITEIPDSVRMTLEGSRIDVNSLEAYVDCSQLTEGEYRLEVVPVLTQGLTLLSLSPVYVTVKVEPYAETQADVTVKYGEGSPAGGYEAQKAVLSQTQVTIRGSVAEIETIAEVFVLVDIDGLKENFEAQLPVYIKDAEGNYITDRFEISPAYIQVVVPILAGGISKSLPVSVKTTGTVASGYTIASITASPVSITVYGEESVLSGLTAIETEAVDIAGLETNLTKNVQLSLPDKVQYFGESNILVTVVVELMDVNEEETVLQNLDIAIENGSDEYTYSISSTKATLTVEGGGERDDYTLFVDVDGLEEGDHEVMVEVRSSGTVVAVDPETVNVTIKKNTE